MAKNTSAHIAIEAPHHVQAEIQRLFKLPVPEMRAELAPHASPGVDSVPFSGEYLRPELCIDHVNLYYINGEDGASWRYDMALVARRFPQASIYYKEMHDDGRDGAATNDAHGRYFLPYGVMVVNNSLSAHASGADLPAIRRCCSEIWTKQNSGFRTRAEVDRFIEVMHRTFPDLARWTSAGLIDLWVNHFVLTPL